MPGKREKAVLIGGAVAAALILLVNFVLIPASSGLVNLSRAASLAEKDLADVRRMRPELERLEREVRPRAGRVAAAANTAESSLARLTAALQESGFPQTSVAIKSGGTRTGEFFNEESFEVKVDGVTYLEAVRLLQKFENGPLPVTVQSVQLKSRYDDSRYIDATVRVGFLRPVTR